MWIRTKDKEQPGKFRFELWSGSDLVSSVGGFATAKEADRAAERAQRALLFPPAPELEHLTDEQLLAELLG